MSTLAVVLLAAGEGSRMLSKRQKVLHEVGGAPMVQHVFEAAERAALLPPVLVVAPGEDALEQRFGDRATYVVQPEQLGTGHAARMAEPVLKGRCDQVLVAYGDMPLLRAETMSQLARAQAEREAALSMLTVLGEPTSTFGRIIRDQEGDVLEVVEVAQARRRPDAEALLGIRELNVGVYCFDAGWLWPNLAELPLRQAREGHEYYLTDLIERAVTQGKHVEAILSDDPDECLSAGTRQELAVVEKAFRRRAAARWLDAGVTLIDPETTYIDQTVTIGQDSIIWPNSYLQGETTIGEDCVIGPNTIVRNSRVGAGCRIETAVVEDSVLAPGERVAPFSYLTGVDTTMEG